MKFLNTLAIVAIAAFLMIGCKAKESTYTAAYKMAQQKELADESVNTPTKPNEATVVSETPTPSTTKVESSAVKVSVEKVTPVDAGDAGKLKKFNVIVGTFSITTNANGLKNSLKNDGYNAFTVQNAKGWYRVVAASFDTREAASSFREAIKQRYAGKFDDAWLLINE
ncbi:MAG: SPOR domain-containing protein [Bacteroidales bacterium]|nr:SPOR domain-containing protein [Bacteroidales bacterium]